MNFQIEFFQNKIKNKNNLNKNTKSNYLSNLDFKKEFKFTNRSENLINYTKEKYPNYRDLSFGKLEKSRDKSENFQRETMNYNKEKYSNNNNDNFRISREIILN